MSTAYDPSKKALGADKLSRIPVKVEQIATPLRKPEWIRIKLPNNNNVSALKKLLRANHL